MEFDLVLDILVALAAIGTIIMFLGWIYDRRKGLQTYVTLHSTAQLLSISGACFVIAQYYSASLLFYGATWILYTAIFFKDENESIEKVKQKTFNLLITTSILVFVALSSIMVDIIETMKTSSQATKSLMESQEKIVDFLESSNSNNISISAGSETPNSSLTE